MHVECLSIKLSSCPPARSRPSKWNLGNDSKGITRAPRSAFAELAVMGGTTHDKEVIDVMLQDTWEHADDWFESDQ